jgi:bacterioferritin
MTDTARIIELLKADMRDEHAAVVQYLQHAYALGESGEACEIEAIAREEMRHFEWLAEAIVELGGKPDMERGFVDLAGTSPMDWMEHDIAAEQRAIDQYQEHIAEIEDPKLKRLLRRILSDEQSHHGDFADLRVELEEEAAEAIAPLAERTGGAADENTMGILQQGIRHEYTVVLQYLYHEFMMPDCEVGNELETQAINEMQHLGWLAEEVAEKGGHPIVEHTDMDLDGAPEDMLRADISVEKAVTMDYTRQIPELDEEDLKVLLSRIRDHEVYHIDVFSDLLKQVGSKEGDEGEQQEDSSPMPDPTASDERLGPQATVGSLMDDK